MKVSLKMISSAILVGLLAIAGCGGGGGGDTSAAATKPTPSATPAPTPSITPTPAPDPLRVKVMNMGIQGGQTVAVEIQNVVAAPVATSASAPAPAASAPVVLPVTSAGTVSATPANQTVVFNLHDGKYFGLSDETGTHLVDPANIAKICASSAQVGYSFLPGQSSRACAKPEANVVTLTGTCNKGDMLYTAQTTDGKTYWFDWQSERAWKIPSDSIVKGVVQADLAHVRWGDYTGATIKVVKTGAGKASVTIDFGGNCLGAFGQINDPEGTSGHLVPLEVEEGLTWYKFLQNCDKCGADMKDGWGLEPWLDTVSNFTVAPSIVEGYLNFNTVTGNYFVTIPDVPCDSKGNITVYKGTKTGEAWIYEPGTTGADDPKKRPFGKGWFPVQKNVAEPQLYTLIPDASVAASFDRANSSLVIGTCN